MPVALLAWDFGTGRGHLVHLRAVAAELKRRGWRCPARLAELDHAGELAAVSDDIASSPPKPRLLRFGEQSSSRYGDLIGGWRFGNSATLADRIDDWRRTIDEVRPDVVVADNAPVAILAARSLDIPVVGFSVPMLSPPADLDSYPAVLDNDRPPLFDEDRLCRAVNRAGERFGLKPAARLPHALQTDDQIVAAVNLLDCYGQYRRAPLVPPVVGEWTEPGERRRDEVFVYLSTFDYLDSTTIAGLALVDQPLRLFSAGAAGLAQSLAGRRNVTVETAPVPAGDIARKARVLVHKGQFGITCLGLRAGIPQVTVPMATEHVFDGRQIAAAGVGTTIEPEQRTARNIQNAVAAAWGDEALTARAEAYAAEVAPEFTGEAGTLAADRIATVIGRA